MNVLLRKNKFRPSTLLIAALLMILTIAVPGIRGTASQSAGSYAELIGTVNVAALPAPTVDSTLQTVALPLLLPNAAALQTAKASAGGASGSTTSPNPTNNFIHVQKQIAGTPGTNPNPCRCSPPDQGLGASDKFVVQMVNLAGTIYSTSGSVRKATFSLSDFWFLPVRGGPIGIGMSDPEVVFDAIAGHWYASIIDTFDVNRVNFAVSATADPTGTWFIYRVIANLGPTGVCDPVICHHTLPDQPYMGYSDDKFLITANDFLIDFNTGTGPFIGVQVWILNKAEMIAGNRFVALVTNDASSTLTTPSPLPSGNANFAIRPAQHLSSTPVAYLAENCETTVSVLIVGLCSSSTTTTGINVYTITGTPGIGPVTVTVNTVATSAPSFPPNADQPGHPADANDLNTGDNRMQSVVWQNNLLWTALNSDCTPTGDTTDRSCIRLDQISTATAGSPVLLKNFDLGIKSAYVFYGAVSLDSSNNLIVVYGESSLSIYPSLEVTGELATAPAGTLGAAQTIAAGSALELSTRYGDYFWAATQPKTPNTFWVAGEFRQISLFQGWSTEIGLVTFNPF
jgi:hypothetical protein